MLKFCQKLLEEKGIGVGFWDLLMQPLPIAIPEFHKNPMETPDDNVKFFNQDVMSADGIILGSPLYHGSYSGVLKNALDNLPFDAFRNKPIGLVSNGSGVRNSSHPCEHLRLVVRALYGYVLQSQIGTGNEDYQWTTDGFVIINEEIRLRAAKLTNELVAFAEVLKKNPINQ